MLYCRSLPPPALCAVPAAVITGTVLCMHILTTGSRWLCKGVLPSVALCVGL